MLLWLVFINCIVGKTIYYNNELGYDCKTNENCVGFGSNLMCVHNKCVYKSRYRRQITYGARILGEECQSNDECRRTPVDGTKACLSNQCQCSSGHVPIDAYRCIRDFEQLSSNTQVMKVSEIVEPPGYGSLCSKNTDCQHSTVQLECLHGTCVCLEGYVPLGKYLCYNIHGHDAPIIESSTLSTTINPPNNDMVKSLVTTCTNDYDCQQFVSKSRCSNGKCSCSDGYLSLDHETCIENTHEELPTISTNYKSLLGGKCLTNQNCQKIDARCLNHICICPHGYFAIDDWNCLEDADSPHSETTTINSPTTTVFQWWPWSTSSTTLQSSIDSADNNFRFRCLINRQCLNIDRNSHCTLLGRCVCNIGYKLDMTNKEQNCVRQIINEENCD